MIQCGLKAFFEAQFGGFAGWVLPGSKEVRRIEPGTDYGVNGKQTPSGAHSQVRP
ncbi:hypothetical protein [Spirosoma utsteinense]|uniref:hypothetical protein n=1 Tax=Spirosoma utsteinense TaxID=2585773 RepID=UPI001646190C|nr:hypothetical protein [Spirosoma utsteinense]